MVGRQANESILRRGFVDICRGYSIGSYQDKTVYVKHLGHIDHLDFDDVKLAFQAEAVEKGAPLEETRVKEIIAKGLWSQSKEDDIARQRDTLLRFEETGKTLAVPSMIREHEKSIDEERKRLSEMLSARETIIGITAESYALQCLNDHYIICNIYTDVGLTVPRFTQEDFFDLNDSAVEEVIKMYNDTVRPCSDDNIRRVAVFEHFIGYYKMCNDDLYTFFGKPVSQLTFYQVRLGNYARHYKWVMENYDISRMPPENRSDPDAIDRFSTSQRNASQLEAEGKTPTNMTPQDIKELGLQGKMTQLPKTNMNMEQFVAHLRRTQTPVSS